MKKVNPIPYSGEKRVPFNNPRQGMHYAYHHQSLNRLANHAHLRPQSRTRGKQDSSCQTVMTLLDPIQQRIRQIRKKTIPDLFPPLPPEWLSALPPVLPPNKRAATDLTPVLAPELDDGWNGVSFGFSLR
ncbi:cytochrome b-c1 complex [Striga asiatica]|uniref:Cytochrome b-c1 complex n=1 Tax=Striga asiatica TaxID=4170 RepID=A0A5A7QS10_STRAF|nr:cytochrome b-c1 complex [Striga asiatica]